MFRENVVLFAIITDKDFKARIFCNIYSFSRRKSVHFFPIARFNWFSYFEVFSRQMIIHYWNNSWAFSFGKRKKIDSRMWISRQEQKIRECCILTGFILSEIVRQVQLLCPSKNCYRQYFKATYIHFLDFWVEDNYLVPVRTVAIFSAVYISSALSTLSATTMSPQEFFSWTFLWHEFSAFLISR